MRSLRSPASLERGVVTAAASSIKQLQAPTIPTDPESIKGAKAWLSGYMPENYEPVEHQAAFTTEFDLRLARENAPSFDKLCRDLEKMFAALEPTPPNAQ
jgi:hypothetical protein